MNGQPAPAVTLDKNHPAIKKVFRRLIPVLVLLYVIAYIDRVNIGFAALSMNQDLALTATMFGLANSAFYIAYSLFEIPSNVMLTKYGPRVWIARIMITWGLASTATMLVVGPYSLYTVRALVGLAEAGFLPGILYYLGSWVPAAHRGRATAIFLSALPIALMVGSPISGLILMMDGWLGLAGWRWLFLIEGLPAVVLGLAVFKLLPDRPSSATWLTAPESSALEAQLASERAGQPVSAQKVDMRSIWASASSKVVLSLGVVYFCIVATINTLGVWSPLIIREALNDTESTVLVGVMGAIPPAFAIIGMLYFGVRSDRTGERSLYCSVLLLIAILGWVLLIYGGIPLVKMAGLTICYMAAFSAMSIFWTAANETLPMEGRAVGIAAVSTLGTFASILSPTIVGALKDMTNSMSAGAWYSSVLLLLGAAAVFVGRKESAHHLRS